MGEGSVVLPPGCGDHHDALRAYDRNHRFNTMAGMPKVRHCNDARPHSLSLTPRGILNARLVIGRIARS
jgi:hypothetical protein